MALSVKLNVFEGPLDLLLHLIDKNKIDIYDIPIVEITDQYMEYLHSMEKEDLGIMSEFLVMAATLLDIKCKMLLPKEVNEEEKRRTPEQSLCRSCWNIKCTNICPMNYGTGLEMRQGFITENRIFRKKCCSILHRLIPRNFSGV